jgi:hypothetical protein
MCTSIIYRDYKNQSFGMGFNRDESFKRKPCLNPTKVEYNGIKYISPIDGDHGGTWIGINSKKIIYAILNLYEAQLKIIKNPTSRGFLVQDLLKEKMDFDEFKTEKLQLFYPFRIIKVNMNITEILSWNGQEVKYEKDDSKWKIIASSFMLGSTAEEIRRSVFQKNYLHYENSMDFINLSSKFLSSHLPERGGASPCMHRRESHTVSNTIVHVTEKGTKVLFKNCQPCESEKYDVYEL